MTRSTRERNMSPQRRTHRRESWDLDASRLGRRARRPAKLFRRPHHPVGRSGRARVRCPRGRTGYSYGIFGGKADKLVVYRWMRQLASSRQRPSQND